MDADRDADPDDDATLKKALAVERAKGLETAAELAVARVKASEDEALIARQKLQIAKLKHQIYGQRSERSARLIEQLALTFEELETGATEGELAAEQAKTTTVRGFTRKRAERQTFPQYLLRERVVIDGPTACECCGSNGLRKLADGGSGAAPVEGHRDVRETFSCRGCEKISQAPAPFHAIARGWAGPSLLAMIMFEKFGQHQPLNRQAERYALEGVTIALSTMADAVGSVCASLDRLLRLVEAHVMEAKRPVGGAGPPAAMFYYSRDRKGEHTRGIWPGMPASCRLTPITGTTSSIWRDASQDQSGRPPAGRTDDVRSLTWPTLKRMRGARQAFTDVGIDNLIELIKFYKENPGLLRR